MSQLSIKTRIETLAAALGDAIDQDGLSQLSIKTRIETQSVVANPKRVPPSLSQLSIKTRIETAWFYEMTTDLWMFESAIH